MITFVRRKTLDVNLKNGFHDQLFQSLNAAVSARAAFSVTVVSFVDVPFAAVLRGAPFSTRRRPTSASSISVLLGTRNTSNAWRTVSAGDGGQTAANTYRTIHPAKTGRHLSEWPHTRLFGSKRKRLHTRRCAVAARCTKLAPRWTGQTGTNLSPTRTANRPGSPLKSWVPARMTTCDRRRT